MSNFPSAPIRARFRKVAQRGSFAVFQALGEIRGSVKPSAYPELLKALRMAAPLHRGLPLQRPKHYQNLLYSGAMPSLTLDRELAWAGVWLKQAVKPLNDLCDTMVELQGLFTGGRLDQMYVVINSFVERQGWSFWAAEIIFALVLQLQGPEALQQLQTKLQEGEKNRPSSLFALVFTERNDPSISFDAFSAKCISSIPRFPDEWLKIYLPFRALSNVTSPEQAYPVILARDMSSSILDYYESVIDCLLYVRSTSVPTALTDAAILLINDLQGAGFTDLRLEKLRRHFNKLSLAYIQPGDAGTESPFFTLYRRIYSFESGPPETEPPFLKQLHSHITACDKLGAAAQENMVAMLKLGVNFKSLPIGAAIALKAIHSSTQVVEGALFPYGLDLVTTLSPLEEVLCNPDDRIINSLRQIKNADLGVNSAIAAEFVAMIDGALPKEISVNRSLMYVWLARYLARNGRLEEANHIVTSLSSLGGTWGRQSLKLRILICSHSGELGLALKEAAAFLLKDFRYAYELPLSLIFKGRKWSEFKTPDPALVGLVAHHANVATPNSSNRFICRMAFRAFYQEEASSNLDNLWVQMTSEDQKAILIAFLREAWIEDNLALLEQFKSTQEIRQERIRILQYLLTWDPSRDQDYSAEIKSLTLDETLWRGLQQINETRVFVNEPAISRWAEKELFPDFERWKVLKTHATLGRLADDILRRYLVEPDVDLLLKSLPKEEATVANTLLLGLLDRLLKRFLSDPADGLNSYLSLRVRHGSLRGTLFGPLEQEGLLLSGETSERAFHDRWDDILALWRYDMDFVIACLREFTKTLHDYVKQIVDEKIQIQGITKPRGVFLPAFDPTRVYLILPFFDADMSFSVFLENCYTIFWAMLTKPREQLAEFFSTEAKSNIQAEIDKLIDRLAPYHDKIYPLLTTLRTVATATQSQCDSVAEWFVPQVGIGKQVYQLSAAIEIAKRATANIYRKFPGQVEVEEETLENLQLSASGLATLYDCLYVIFENAWKHSGLGEWLGTIQLQTKFNAGKNYLTLTVRNKLSQSRLGSLKDGELQALKDKYLTALTIELVPKEGGSGFAKLARMVSGVDTQHCPQPLDFGLDDDGKWYVKVVIPLYEREGIFDAYQ